MKNRREPLAAFSSALTVLDRIRKSQIAIEACAVIHHLNYNRFCLLVASPYRHTPCWLSRLPIRENGENCGRLHRHSLIQLGTPDLETATQVYLCLGSGPGFCARLARALSKQSGYPKKGRSVVVSFLLVYQSRIHQSRYRYVSRTLSLSRDASLSAQRSFKEDRWRIVRGFVNIEHRVQDFEIYI